MLRMKLNLKMTICLLMSQHKVLPLFKHFYGVCQINVWRLVFFFMLTQRNHYINTQSLFVFVCYGRGEYDSQTEREYSNKRIAAARMCQSGMLRSSHKLNNELLNSKQTLLHLILWLLISSEFTFSYAVKMHT